MALPPIAFTVRPNVDTQGSLAQVANGITQSNLIRIKNGYVQKLGGCAKLGTFLYPGSNAMQAMLGWTFEGHALLSGANDDSTQVVADGSVAFDITSAATTGFGPSLALWGSWLLNASIGQSIYYWVTDWPPTGTLLPVSGLPGATGVPTAVNGIFVAAPQQQTFAWGVYDPSISAQDPLLVAWCDIANLQDWTASAINQAGSFKLSSGSEIISGTWFGQVGLLWTDIELWAVNYINFPLVYGFQRIGENCGLIAQNAWGILGTMIAWMGGNDFYAFQGGAVQPIPCSVRDFVFNSLDRGQRGAIHCDVNSYNNEIMWRFPQIGSQGKCTAYVKWSPAENNAWDFGVGQPNIVSWTNTDLDYSNSGTFTGPVGCDYSGNILQFETGFEFNGAALDSFFITGWFYIAEGQESVFVERINPDFVFNSQPGFVAGPAPGTMLMTFYFADEIPTDQIDYPVRTYGPYTVTAQTPFIVVRGSGRVMQMKIECTDGATFYRNGKHLARVAIDGKPG